MHKENLTIPWVGICQSQLTSLQIPSHQQEGFDFCKRRLRLGSGGLLGWLLLQGAPSAALCCHGDGGDCAFGNPGPGLQAATTYPLEEKLRQLPPCLPLQRKLRGWGYGRFSFRDCGLAQEGFPVSQEQTPDCGTWV